MQFIFTPSWFALSDVLISGISAAVTLVLAAYVFKIYNFTKENRLKTFSLAFLAISASFIISAATHFFAYYNLFEKHAAGIGFYTFNILHSATTFYAAGELIFRALMLGGLLMIFHVMQKNSNRKIIALTMFFAAIVVLFSITHYYMFYLTTFVIVGLITYHLLFNYLENPCARTASLLVGFGIIAACQGMLILAGLETVYVFAGLSQILGYSLLLATYIQLQK